VRASLKSFRKETGGQIDLQLVSFNFTLSYFPKTSSNRASIMSG
jgi:hypothetical protein